MDAIFWPSAMRARRRASKGLSVGVGRDGDGEVVHRRLQGIVGVLARVGDVADDQHLYDSAASTVNSAERVVEDYHIGGVGVERCRVGVDEHRVDGADRLQVYSKLAET